MGAFLSVPPVLATDRELWEAGSPLGLCVCSSIATVCLVCAEIAPFVSQVGQNGSWSALLVFLLSGLVCWLSLLRQATSGGTRSTCLLPSPQEATPVWGRWAAGLEKQVFLTRVIGKSVMLPDRKKQAPCHFGSGGHSGHLFSFPWPLPFLLDICALLSLVRLFSVS